MNRKVMLRLGLDFSAAAMLLVALAYYWLDNTVHELVGTAMFVVLIAHNTLNRQWYSGFSRPQEARRTLDKALVLCLLAAMAVLLITSVMISQTVSLPLASPDSFGARRIHVLAAYWALILVALHIGIRWRVILGLAGNVFVPESSGVRSTMLRLSAAGIAAAGIYSSFEIGVGAKLLSQVTMEWWDFTESTWGFFLHHIAIVSLYAFLAHYAFGWIKRGRAGTTDLREQPGARPAACSRAPPCGP